MGLEEPSAPVARGGQGGDAVRTATTPHSGVVPPFEGEMTGLTPVPDQGPVVVASDENMVVGTNIFQPPPYPGITWAETLQLAVRDECRNKATLRDATKELGFALVPMESNKPTPKRARPAEASTMGRKHTCLGSLPSLFTSTPHVTGTMVLEEPIDRLLQEAEGGDVIRTTSMPHSSVPPPFEGEVPGLTPIPDQGLVVVAHNKQMVVVPPSPVLGGLDDSMRALCSCTGALDRNRFLPCSHLPPMGWVPRNWRSLAPLLQEVAKAGMLLEWLAPHTAARLTLSREPRLV
jgi:hypothetical protein